MKKKTIIIVVVILIVIGVIIWLLLKKKKATTTTTTTVLKSGLPEGPISSNSQVATTTPVLQTSAGKFTSVIRDGSKGMAILRHEPSTIPVAVGGSIIIPSGIYAGTQKIWYIFSGVGFKNLYIDTPFKGDASGTFTKA